MFSRLVLIAALPLGLVLVLLFTASNNLSLTVAQNVQATAIPTAQATPDPLVGLTIPELAARSYGNGQLKNWQVINQAVGFTRYLISYPSDGLTIYGFMDVPTAPPRVGSTYPVVIAVHGYIAPGLYQTIDYTARYADRLSAAGFLVLHPNLRNYYPSDKGPNVMQVGYAVDVLNLIAMVRKQGGQPGTLQHADPTAVGLWGHSMGGGISIRVMEVDQQIQAVVLFNAVSGDTRHGIANDPNAPYTPVAPAESNRGPARPGLIIPDAVYQLISPINFYDRVRAAISIHYGLADKTVSPQRSVQLCAQLLALQKSVECYSYPNEPHNFGGASDQLFIQRTIAFFNAHLQVSTF